MKITRRKLLEEISEAILEGGIIVDNIRLRDEVNGWKKISFWYKFGNIMTKRDKEIEKLSKNDITELIKLEQ